jgi:hypothetical protein
VKTTARSLGTLVEAALLAATAIFLLAGRKDSGAVHADISASTENAAASAGARILATDLKVEPS